MSKMRIFFFGLALGSMVLAGLLAKSFLGRKPQTEVVEVNKVQMAQVLVAAKDMAMGERLADTNTKWLDWPQANISDAMITQDKSPDARDKLQTARARLPIVEGEPIVEKKIIKPDQSGFMSAILPKGMRAISVAISERSAAGGFILPNDRVDVILTRKLDDPQSSQKIVKSETVLTNVRILAINQTYRQEAGEDKVTVTEGKTATLELNPQQTEVVSMIESAGELSLALRSIAENGDKGLDDGGPRLADKYANKKRSGGAERLFVRYGIETATSSR
ncbi:MAG: Flp pilus assembly protein CpaB [Rhizobiales bacterium]|nr:Flp pilus assembly protein CpaB [Hyphomicrobiales bacterium]MBI3673679.1 Flp pilus assembly protein CpaB [Hyphomicrobiales bacterium]